MKMKEINLKEAIDLIKASGSTFTDQIIKELQAYYSDSKKIKAYQGKTELPELSVDKDIILFNGNLKVKGIVEDCKKCDQSLLIVLGNLEAVSLITLSTICITGDLTIENVILGDSLCNFTLMVGGNINAPTILDYGHSIISKKDIKAEHVYSFHCIQDSNGEIESNLETDDLIDEILINENEDQEDDEDYEPEMQPELGETVEFIRSGGRVFHKK